MEILIKKPIIVAFAALTMLWSCKDSDTFFQPEVYVQKFKNDTLDVNALPPIQEPGNNNGGGNQQEKEVMHVVKVLGGGANTTAGNFIDLSNGTIYNNSEVLANQNQVDLMMINFGNGTRNNLIVPDSKEIAFNDYGNKIQRGWDVQNKGVIYRLTNLQKSDIEWYNKVIKNAALTKGIDSFINEIIPVRNVTEYTNTKAKKRLRNIAVNSMVFFKSTDRKVNSVMIVTNSDNTISNEHLRLNIKSDASAKVSVPAGSGALKPNYNGLDMLTINYDVTKYQAIALNLATGDVYPTAADIPTPSSVYLVFTFNPNNKRTYLYTPQSSWYINWDKNLGDIYWDNLAASTTYTRFSAISTFANYPNKKIENVGYNTSDLVTYYSELENRIGYFVSHTTNVLNEITTVYPYVNRFARTAISGGLPILEYGAFSLIENDSNSGRLIFGYKYSTIQD